MGHHEIHCNANHGGPVGNDMCTCAAGADIKELRQSLGRLLTLVDGLPVKHMQQAIDREIARDILEKFNRREMK